MPTGGFNRNRILRTFIISLVDAGITAFVETGTQWGLSCLWLAKRRLNIPIYTCEVDPRALAVAEKALTEYKQVHMYKESSPEFLGKIVELVGRLPLFYLDAHGGSGTQTFPVRNELQVIGEKYNCACIIIHDFQVPGIPKFGHEGYRGVPLNLDYIRPALSPNHKYRLFYPSRYVPHAGLQGWAVLFQNTPPLGDISDLKEGEL